MRIKSEFLILVVVAAIAFALGRTQWFDGVEPAAVAQSDQDQGEGLMDEQMAALLKAGIPGDHHKILDKLVGKWEGGFTMQMAPDAPPMKSTGSVTRKWILDGRFIQEEVEAEMDGEKFEGIGFIGYNNLTGLYEAVWMENMSTGIYSETGCYDTVKQSLMTRGTHHDPATGRLVPTRGKMDLSSPDRHVYEGYAVGEDGQEFKSFSGVLERVK